MSRTWLRRTAPIAALAAASLVLSACSSGGSTGDSTSSGDASGDATSESTDGASSVDLANTGWVSADRDAIADGGTLTLPIDAYPANFNISHQDAGTVDDNTIAGLYLPGFITMKADASWDVDTNYADTVELTSDDPQVVHVKIADAAKWSDGTEMTYKDFQGAWNAQKALGTDYQIIATNVWSDIASVEQGDTEKDIVITFSQANADWPSVLTGIYPYWVYETPEAFNTGWQKGPFAQDGTTFVSGGPFIVEKLDENGGVITFGKNPQWWGDEAKLDTVIFKTVSRTQLAASFGNSEIDVMNVYGSKDNLQTAEKRADAKIERSLGTTFRHITLNGQSETFSDAKVREAFAMMLDRSTIAQAILSPVGSPVIEINNLIFMPGQAGYEDNAGQYYGHDAEKAKALLEEAGVSTPVTVRFVIPTDTPASANVAQLVQQQGTAAGFDIQIDTVPSDDFFTKYINADERDFDATYFAWRGTAFPITSTESLYYPADSPQNYPGITNDNLGAMWDKVNAELDVDKRLKDADAIDEELVQLFGTLPLFPEPYVWAVKDTLVNYGPAQFESVAWQNVGFTS